MHSEINMRLRLTCMSKIRTRFAPSPTGFLHIGSLRTVLFAYLLAKGQGGKIILRVEDTDQKRSVAGAEEKLIAILDWLGLKFDEGPHLGGKYAPYRQSERKEIYQKYADELLNKGLAYRCFCTPERLRKMREQQQAEKQPPRYDRTCRNLSQAQIEKKLAAKEPYVIRQPMPEEGTVAVRDELRGKIEFKAEDLDDHVLIKSDGMPTYQFAVVVDDHIMEISHVLRGEEWIPSFPKNILLYRAFGWTPPLFIHLPLTLNKGGGKLSKRQGDAAVEDYKDKGYLPEALLNYSALLGWSPKGEKEIFSLAELAEIFKIKDLGISAAVFDIAKLDYLNGYYIRQKPLDELVELCQPYLSKYWDNFSQDYIKKIISLEQERLKRLDEIGELTEFFFVNKLKYEPELLIWKKLAKDEVKNNLQKLFELLEKIPEKNWTDNSIEDAIITYLRAKEQSRLATTNGDHANKISIGEYLWPMRAALTGRKASPGPFEVAEVLGKDASLERIRAGISKLL